VTGTLVPLRLNPGPLTAITEIVTDDPPVLVTVSESVLLTPTCTLPKLRLVGFEPRVPAATPVPDNGIVNVGFEPFEVTVTVPLAAPADVGSNETLKLLLWPEVSVTGTLVPLRLNPGPLTAMAEIVTDDPPVLVTVSERVCLTPTCTLPKLRLVGFDVRSPGARPVPDSGMVKVGFDAFEVTVTFPVTAVADTGVYATLKVALWPAVRVTGAVIPLSVKPVPLIPTAEIVTLVPPVFVTVSERVFLTPTCTLPKLRLVGFDPRAPAASPVPDSGMVNVGFEAFEVTVTLPVTALAEVGVNETLKLVLWPAASVTGTLVPLRLNPDPLTPI